MQTRRDFLATAATAPLSAAQPERPNIVFLMPDQHRAQTLGCMGDDQARTPNIDRLATEGVVLENTFANTPVCCPARAILLTGQYCHRNGMVANDLRLSENSTSFAKELHKGGYRTAFVGKWHLDGGPRLPGFVPPGERRQGFDYWVANQCSHMHFRNTVFRDTPDPIVLDKFETDGYADFAVEFLRSAKISGQPFYLTVQWGPPHDPYKAPEEYSARYDPARLRMRPNYRAESGAPDAAAIAQYYAMVTAIDDAVGRILGELDRLGLRENTIVLYASDHGDMLGSHGERLKRKPWEESIKVPGILRWPGKIKPGTRTKQFFTHVDFAPTLLGLAGLTVPKEMQGENLAPAFLNGARGPDSAFFQIFGPFAGDGTPDGWRGVRTERYMYARFRERPWVLYDLSRDPFQMKNLANEDSARGVRQEMERRLAAWMEKTGDNWAYNWTHPVEDKGRLYRHRTFRSVSEYLAWARQHPDLDASR
jgi:arylsulfatase A-like enzyme